MIGCADLEHRPSARTLRPLALVFCSPVWLLSARCGMRGDLRTLRLDRVTALQVTDQVFADEAGRNLATYRQREPGC